MAGRKKNHENHENYENHEIKLKSSKSTKHLWISLSLFVILSIIFIIILEMSKENSNADDNILKDTENTLNETEKYDDYNYIDDNDNSDNSDNSDTPDKFAENKINPGDDNITKSSENAEADMIAESNEETAKPPIKAKKAYQNKFDLLRGKFNNNEDIIGFVKIPGTVINYPVAHYTDNDFYLNRNLYKNRSSAGCIFMDYENSLERSDPNTILYGHKMSSNSMFHSLSYFENEDYFNKHRYIIFNTIYEDNVWEIFAYFKAHVSFYYIKVAFRSEREFLNLAAEMKERSLHDTDIEIEAGDRILVLSTCTNIDPDTRNVVVARRIKNKEDIPADIMYEMTSAVDNYK